MTTWIDTQDPTKVDAALTRLATHPQGQRAIDYAGGEPEFGLWLAIVDRRVSGTYGLGIFDLQDWAWRDLYDAGLSPTEAAREAVEDGLVEF